MLKCELCEKRFNSTNEVYVHPFSLIRPRFVHRSCISYWFFPGPVFSLSSLLEMSIPILVFGILLVILFSLYVNWIFAALIFVVIPYRVYMYKQYLNARDLIKKNVR